VVFYNWQNAGLPICSVMKRRNSTYDRTPVFAAQSGSSKKCTSQSRNPSFPAFWRARGLEKIDSRARARDEWRVPQMLKMHREFFQGLLHCHLHVACCASSQHSKRDPVLRVYRQPKDSCRWLGAGTFANRHAPLDLRTGPVPADPLDRNRSLVATVPGLIALSVAAVDARKP